MCIYIKSKVTGTPYMKIEHFNQAIYVSERAPPFSSLSLSTRQSMMWFYNVVSLRRLVFDAAVARIA